MEAWLHSKIMTPPDQAKTALSYKLIQQAALASPINKLGEMNIAYRL